MHLVLESLAAAFQVLHTLHTSGLRKKAVRTALTYLSLSLS